FSRSFATLNAMAMRAAAADNDWSEVSRRFSLGLSLHTILQHQITSYERVRQCVIVIAPLSELGTLLNEHDMPGSVCRELLNVIEEFEWPGVNIVRTAIEGEVILGLDAIQHRSTTDGMRILPEHRDPTEVLLLPWTSNVHTHGPRHVEHDRRLALRVFDLPPDERETARRQDLDTRWEYDGYSAVYV